MFLNRIMIYEERGTEPIARDPACIHVANDILDILSRARGEDNIYVIKLKLLLWI